MNIIKLNKTKITQAILLKIQSHFILFQLAYFSDNY
jgi:hypothetical protein